MSALPLALAVALAAGGPPSSAPTGAWTRTPPPPALEARRWDPPAAKEAVLPTGLRVVVVEHHRRPIVVARLILARGALTDPPGFEGVSWLALQLASDFHEVTQTGEELVDERSFRRQIIELGGSARFDVTADASLVEVSGYAGDAGRYLRMMGEAIVNPRRGHDAFRARRNALLDEVEDLETSDPEALGRALAEAAFGAKHPYARSVIGTATSLAPMGLEDVVSQQDRILSPEGATLLVVGDVSAAAILDAARAAFGRWRRPTSGLPRVAPPGPPPAQRQVDFLRRQPASTLVVCASRPLGDARAGDEPLRVLATVLGGGVGSRLYVALRERMGLTYGAWAQILERRWARAFLACSALAADRAEEGVRTFRETLQRAATEPIGDEEVARARAILLGQLESTWDDAEGIATAWVRAIALGRQRPRPQEDRAAIARVTGDEVRALSRSLLEGGTLRWIVSGEARAASRAVVGNRLGTLRSLTPGR
jgi:zinc protease